jgi:hypothetical protein
MIACENAPRQNKSNQLLATFKGATPRLGLSPRLLHAIDWLFRFTLAEDWARGGRRPIA